jgi:hypothetical protein
MVKGSDVTMIIPTIPGREELLDHALRSIVTQQVKPGAVVVKCDVERQGAYWARNEAIKEVKTDWIGTLDDDDILLPNHIKVLVRGLNRTPEPDMCFSYARFVGGRDPLACIIGQRLIPEPINVPWDNLAHFSFRRYGNFIPCCYLLRTELVRQVGGFPAPYSMPEVTNGGECEDYLLLIKMLDAGARFHHVCGVRTWEYRFHDTNTGGRGRDRMHELGEHHA